MAGTTGLEPATSDVTGRRRQDGQCGYRFALSALRGWRGACSETATVRATVLDNRGMPVLAYNDCSAGKAGATAQVGLACRLACSADGLPAVGSTEARFRVVPSADWAKA